jgi:lipoprotein-anchoring transpeptidase ErfK/SrfK
MRGEPLARRGLPLAFVHQGDAEAYGREADVLRPVGMVEHRARFPVADEVTIDGRAYVEGPDGMLLTRDAVRVVRTIRRPHGIDRDEKWIHVDLDEQTLTAYEGNRPVYATLVSSGIDGFDTPDGLYRIRRKYISRTMSGPDPDHGSYEIEEVPWTMYYRGGLAVHGAYWHDEFGRVRSHGCTNVPPADARWLFLWTAPEIPQGWNGVHEAGTHIYFSRG